MPPILARGLTVPSPTRPTGPRGEGFLPPGEIRRRIDAYLASPELTAAERAAALDYLDTHPEVASAGGDSPGADAVRRRAALVLRLCAAAAPLIPASPEGMVRLRAAAEGLARDACRLLGVDPSDPG